MLVIGLDPVFQHPVRGTVLVARVGKVRHTQEVGADQDPQSQNQCPDLS
jgi:hypothetical protein